MATIIRPERTITLTAVDATPLDGSTANRTYKPADRTAANSIRFGEEVDSVIITMDGTGADGNSAVFSLWGYHEENGFAHRIYHTATATLGTAVHSTGRVWAEIFAGTDTHVKTVGLTDSGAAGNSIAKLLIDKMDYRFLMFEPTTFTTLTAITFHVREIGTK